MSVSAREMLERLRVERRAQQPADQGAADVAAQPERSAQAEQPAAENQARVLLNQLRQKRDRGPMSLVRSFNKGLVDLLAAPVDFFNWLGTLPGPVIGNEPMFIPGTHELRQTAADLGFTAPPGQEAQGVLPRAAEIAGSSVVPLAGMMARGRQVIAAMPKTTTPLRDIAGRPVTVHPRGEPGMVGQMTSAMAESPRATIAGEAAASLGAGLGGEVAAQFSDDPAIIAIGELAGGFTPAALVTGPQARLIRRGIEAGRSTLAPFTRAGAEPRAARALQSRSADPEAAADRIGHAPELSPARQTGERRLLELERAVLDQDPALDARFSEQLATAVQNARRQALDFGGDVERPRALLERGRDYLVNLVNLRAAQAARAASDALAKLDQNASPRDISRTAREHLETAYRDARTTERQLWGAIDKTAPAELANARRALQDELSTRSEYDDPADMPAWLHEALDDSARLPHNLVSGLRSAGLLASDGSVPAFVISALERSGALPRRALIFRDVHALRGRVRRAIREERAATAPNRNKIRILSNVEEALLDDLAATNVAGVQAARDFSRALNERFTQGSVGRLLGFERRGGRATDPADTLSQVLGGRATATKLAQFLNAAPDARPQIEQFVKSAFLLQASDGNSINQAAAERFMRRWRDRGIFEAFPGLEAELAGVRNVARAAERWGVRAGSVERLAHHAQKSRAALYLNSPPKEEMSAVLRARNPAAVARSLVRRMRGDQSAVQGLKTLFVEELFRQSAAGRFNDAGEPIVSGGRFAKLLRDYRGVASALGMTDPELTRLNRTANTLRLAERQATASAGKIVDDNPAMLLDLLARLIGAHSGQRLAGAGFGASLVLSQFGSNRMRQLLGRLTRDKATELVIAAHSDATLYRALLLRPTASARRQAQAARKLEAWMLGVVLPGEPAERPEGDRPAPRAVAPEQPPDGPQAAARPGPSQLDIDRAASVANAAPTQAQKDAGEGNYRLGDPVRLHGVTWRVETPKGAHRVKLDEQAILDARRAYPNKAFRAQIDGALRQLRAGRAPEAFDMLRHASHLPKPGSKARTKLTAALAGGWHNLMPAHYARAVGVQGADGDKLDAFIGPRAADQSLPVYVIDTRQLSGRGHDESKVMLGYGSPEEAKAAFLASYDRDVGTKIFREITELSPLEFAHWIESGGSTQPGALAMRAPSPEEVASRQLRRGNMQAAARVRSRLERGKRPGKRETALLSALDDEQLAALGLAPEEREQIRERAFVDRTLAEARRRRDPSDLLMPGPPRVSPIELEA